MVFFICQTYLDHGESMEDTLDFLEDEIDFERKDIQEIIETCIDDYR